MWNTMLSLVVLCFVLQCQLEGFVEGVSFEEDVRISYKQKMSIDKLKRRILPHISEGYMKDDIYLVKWLRATNFDIYLAERKLLENLKWRKENRISTIAKEDFSDVAEEYPYMSTGIDNDGRPIFIAFAGDWDIRNAVVTGRIKRIFRYLDQGLEGVATKIRTLQQEGKNVTQGTLIIELSQFSLVQHACVQCLMRIADFLHGYEAHYPGMADKVFFVDAPPAVQFVIELIKNNVSKETREAINVYGTNKYQWQEAIKKNIDIKYLPLELGGSLQRL